MDASDAYIAHVRASLRTTTTLLQTVAITAWAAALAVNPEITAPLQPHTAAIFVALVAVCLWKGLTPHLHAWRLGTVLYGLLLAMAFRMQLDMMTHSRDQFLLPLTVLLSVGFSGVVALRRDFIAIVVLIWSVMLLWRAQPLPDGMHPQLATILAVATVLVSVGLNYAIVLNLRRTFLLGQRFRILSETDPLTGLSNRRVLLQHLQTACQQGKAGGWHLALLDIDDFKSINDRFGHDTGDEALLAMASALRGLPPQTHAGRLGGEEFGILVRGLEPDAVDTLLAHLHATVRGIRVPEIGFSFSAGVTRVRDGDQPSDVLQRADAGMYRAKRTGKDRVVWYDASPSA